jgi:uncharacterized membrane-anchored protein
MIKELIAYVKIAGALTMGIFGLLGIRYIAIIVHDFTKPMHVLIQILVFVALIIGAIALWCDYYLKKEYKKWK